MSDYLLLALLAGLIADWFFGEPEPLWGSIPHPVVVMGRLIGTLDTQLNDAADEPGVRYRYGALAWLTLMVVALAAGMILDFAFALFGPLGLAGEAFVVFALVAQKSLKDHVAAVRDALQSEGLGAARRAVSRIVGRDPEQLDRAGVSRAAIESLAENFCDGVVAPAFWYAVFGLPGLIAYKMINTADSMIGHRSEKYLEFGRVAAQADDLANWLPARLSAALVAAGAGFVFGAGAARNAFGAALRDAGLHRSPNAGWPEAAMAGALGIALGGPRVYPGETVQQAFINASGMHDADAPDIGRAITVFSSACFALWGLAGLLLLAGISA